MMGAIGPGDWLECIDSGPCKCGCGCPSGLAMGRVYLVLDVWEFLGMTGVALVGFVPPGGHDGTNLGRFRPIFSDPQAVTKSIHNLLTVPAPGELVEAQ